jgi:hypothetical protein
MYFVNLFGAGIRYWICDIHMPRFLEMDEFRKKHDFPWENLMFDIDFLRRFNCTHWSELSTYQEQRAFTLSRENRIEIKHKGRFLEKFTSLELLGDGLLFPKYSTQLLQPILPTIEEHQRIILVQYETGLFAKFQFDTSAFDTNQLSFILIEPIPNETKQWLHGIQINGKEIKPVQEEMVVRGSHVIFP